MIRHAARTVTFRMHARRAAPERRLMSGPTALSVLQCDEDGLLDAPGGQTLTRRHTTVHLHSGRSVFHRTRTKYPGAARTIAPHHGARDIEIEVVFELSLSGPHRTLEAASAT